MTPLKKSTLFAYSLADLPIAMSLSVVMVFIPRHYSSDLGIPLVTVTAIMLAQRILDLFGDPLMGWLSDRTRSRFGRRKPWVAASAPILTLSVYQLFMPPEGAGALHLFVWGMLLGIGTTMLLIPYYAWGAELSPEYHERSRVAGARAMMGVVGSLASNIAPMAALVLFGIGGSGPVLEIVGTTAAVLMPLCILFTVTQTPEPSVSGTSTLPVMAGMRLMVRNKPFLQLVIAFMIGSIGLSISTPLYLFFVADVLGAEKLVPIMLTCFYLTNLAAVPLWVLISRRIGKHRAYIAAFFVISCTHPFYLLLGKGDFWWMLPITLATGFAAGGFSQLLPNSMKADVIDLDTLASGENRAAQYFSAWSFAQKAAGSLGGVIALFGLSLFGFDATLRSANGPEEMFGLRFLFSTLPSLFFIAGALIVWNYPITEARQREIRAEIESRAPSTPEPA